MKPKVSVICLAYNQNAFIRQCLDGFVMQKTSFPFEVLVHDDASTDGTADIIREYAQKYPDIIKPIFQSENQWSKGISIYNTHICPKICGKYVAVCDGDDFWTDPHKLQKQVRFLDRHPEYSICFHPVSVLYDDGRVELSHTKRPTDLSLNNLLTGNFIPNLSVMYRWHPKGHQVEQEIPKNIYPSDWFMHLLHAKYGKIGFLPDVMGCYRRNSGGISFVSEFGPDALHVKYGLNEMNFFINAERIVAATIPTYHRFVKQQARAICSAYIRAQDLDKALHVLKMCPDLMRECVDQEDIKHWHHRFNYLFATCVTIIVSLIMGILIFL